MHPLDGSFLKLNRAKHHFKAADELMQGFNNRKPYEIVTSFEGKGQARECFLRLKEVEAIPIDLSLLIGDICNNLRSALDHLLWQLWLLIDPTFDGNVYFPICDSPSTFNTNSPRDIGGLPDTQKTVIGGLQPYRTKNPALSILRDVNNCDKHRLIQIIGLMVDINRLIVTPAPITAKLKIPMPPRIPIEILSKSVKVENGATIARIPLDSSRLGTEVRVQSTTNIKFVFSGSKTADGKHIRPTLGGIILEVARILELFESEFAQFGVSEFK